MYTETWASDSGESYEIVFLSSEISVCIEIWTQGGKNGGLSWPRLGLVTSLAPYPSCRLHCNLRRGSEKSEETSPGSEVLMV